ncbi:MAG: tetratricopeptide repeat protein [Phycisphaerae bacterium]
MAMSRSAVTSIMIITTALLSASVSAQDRTGRMSEREVVRLAESLSEAGMTELLEALIEERSDLRDTPAGFAMQAELRVAEANRIGYTDQEQQPRRRELLNEAAELLGRAAEATANATSDAGKINHFRYRLKRIDILATQLPRPELVRLMFLRGGRQDRELARRHTEDVVGLMEGCLLDMEDMLQDWRMDLVKLATVMPELESLHQSAVFQAGWVRFYRGMVLPRDDEQRMRLLSDAVQNARRFADQRRGGAARRRAMLLAGMAAREMGEYEQARQFLDQADDRSAAPALRVQAKFQKARAAVEAAGAADKGIAAVETFQRELADILGEGAGVQIDLHTAMLKEHLYRELSRLARQQGDEQRAQEHAHQAEFALLEFLEKHGDAVAQRVFLELVARKHAGGDEGDSPLLLLARAQEAPSEETEDLLRELLSREGEVAERIRPLAIWRLGLFYAGEGRYRRAAEQFLKLARDYSDHRLAFDAAQNAAAAFRRVVRDVEDSDETPAPALRREFIKILRLVTEGWPQRDEAARWNFELGWQLQQLTPATDEPLETLRQAVDAYQKVPEVSEDSLEARYLALRLRTRILRDSDWSQEEKRRRAEELVEELRAYADRVAAMLPEDDAQEDYLASWGGQADLEAAQLEYDVLGRREAALERIRKLPDKWPDREILRAAAEFEIRRLVETDRTDEAIERVEEFRREYPDHAESLVRLVAWQVRTRLRDIAWQSGDSEQMRRLRSAFLEFTSDLYERSEGQSDSDRYIYIQMYAEALLVNDRPQEALELFRRCRDIDERMRSEDPDRPIDATNIRGLAGAHQALGNYDRAAELYGDLVAGMDPGDPLYWRTELAYCRALLEARRDDPGAMRRLILRIRQLRDEDRLMGQLFARFDEIEAAARTAMGQ